MAKFANGVTWGADFTALVADTPTYVEIAEVVAVNFDGITADAIDDTVHGDTWRTFVAGLKNGGTVSMTVRYGPETHADLLDNVGEKFANEFTFPLETSSNLTPLSIEWDAVFTSMSIAAPHDGLFEATVSLQLSGAPTITDEAAA